MIYESNLKTNYRGEFQNLLLLLYIFRRKIKLTSMYFKTDMNGIECWRNVDLLTQSIPQK